MKGEGRDWPPSLELGSKEQCLFSNRSLVTPAPRQVASQFLSETTGQSNGAEIKMGPYWGQLLR